MYLVYPMISIFCVALIIAFLPQHSKVRIFSKQLVSQMRGRQVGFEPTENGHYFGGNERQVRVQIVDVMNRMERKKYLLKRARAFRPLGFQISFFGVYTLGTSGDMMDQLFNNVILLLSL